MNEMFPFLILLLVSLPFGFIPFLIIAIIEGAYLFVKKGKIAYFSIPITAFLYIFHPLLGIISVVLLAILDDDEPFVRISAIIGSMLVVFILFPIIYLFWVAPPNVNGDLIAAIITSIVAATAATLVGIAFAIPLGYVLARRNFGGKEIVEGIIDLPIVIPHTVSGIILLLIFGSAGIIGSSLEKIGLRFYYSLPGIIVAMLFVSVPFLINQIREGIEKIDERYELVAMSLGASRTYAFFTVLLPLIKRNIFAGAINSWARAMSEFGAVIMIAFYPMIAPTYIYFLYENYGLKASLPATSFLLIVVLLIFITLRVILGRFKNAGN